MLTRAKQGALAGLFIAALSGLASGGERWAKDAWFFPLLAALALMVVQLD